MSYRIFISHKMPTDTAIAELIGKRIVKYASDKLEVVHAGMFRTGEDFIVRIKQEIAKANIFIWLFTGEEEDWSNCMFECGLFESNPLVNDKLLVVFRKNDSHEVPVLIRQYNNIPVSKGSMRNFITQLYKATPWLAAPKADDADIDSLAADIADIFNRNIPRRTPYELVPGFQIEVTMSEENKRLIVSGQIPPKCNVSGRQNWQILFGRKINTGDWTWEDLTRGWPVKALYEYELAKMMDVAMSRDAPRGCFLRTTPNSEMYRISLQTLSVIEERDLMCFDFTAVPIDIPFYFFSDAENPKDFLPYQLLNISFYVRRRLVDDIYNDFLKLISNPKRSDIDTNNMISRLREELNNIDVQSYVRGIDSVLEINDALPELAGKKYATLWLEHREKISDLAQVSPVPLREIAEQLFALANINYDFYVHSAKAYAASAMLLPPPRDVNTV